MRIRDGLIWLTGGAAVAGGVIAGASGCPPAQPRPGAEPTESSLQEYLDARRDADTLAAERAAAIPRWEERQVVVRALVQGDLTLEQAAARFRDLNGPVPNNLASLQGLFPEATVEEMTYWQVLRHALIIVRHDPTVPDGAAMLARLNSEYRERFPAGPDPDWGLLPGPPEGQPPP